MNLHFAEDRFGALQPLEGALLRRQRRVRLPFAEVLLGGLHFAAGGVELGGNQGERAVRRGDAALAEPRHQAGDVLANFALGDRQSGEIFAALALLGPGAVPQPVEGSGNNLPLAHRKALG